jgi:hypothetical protein
MSRPGKRDVNAAQILLSLATQQQPHKKEKKDKKEAHQQQRQQQQRSSFYIFQDELKVGMTVRLPDETYLGCHGTITDMTTTATTKRVILRVELLSKAVFTIVNATNVLVVMASNKHRAFTYASVVARFRQFYVGQIVNLKMPGYLGCRGVVKHIEPRNNMVTTAFHLIDPASCTCRRMQATVPLEYISPLSSPLSPPPM